MDINNISSQGMDPVKLQQDVQASLLKNSLDNMEVQGQQLIELMEITDPNLGMSLDIKA